MPTKQEASGNQGEVETSFLVNKYNDKIRFEFTIVDADTGGRVAIGDIDGDGNNDIISHVWGTDRGKINDGILSWYRYPEWQRIVIRQGVNLFGDALVVTDLDSDGDNDVVTCRGNDKRAEVWWYENVINDSGFEWAEHYIGLIENNSAVKDIEAHDMDNDHILDIVVRTIHFVAIYFQNKSTGWAVKKIKTKGREGMALADLDGDRNCDIVLNGFWFKNPTHPRNDGWLEYVIDHQWFTDNTGGWQDHSVMVDVKDFNGDGRVDVLFSHSEKTGVKIAWYESKNPKGGQRAWSKHEVGVVDYCHTLRALDIDQDGDTDIIGGSLKRTNSPRILLFLNDGTGLKWSIRQVDKKSVYKGQLGDIDNDGDFDLVSAASWENGPIQLWRNLSNSNYVLPIDLWERHLIDDILPDKAVFIRAGDLDADGLIDLVAGGWWWKNPGYFHENWSRRCIGSHLNNMVLIYDFDHDGDLDIFGTQGSGASSNNSFAWARNDGSGNFVVLTNINTCGFGDFVQGCARVRLHDSEIIVISWHNGGGGLHFYKVPVDPSTKKWTCGTLTSITLKEDLSVGDIDGDGDFDLLLGTAWLRYQAGDWIPFEIGHITDLGRDVQPDRNDLADINRDGRLDAVIGLENGKQILWFEAPADPTGLWMRHIIGRADGQGFSMDTADFDRDGDLDVVLGEHRGPVNNRVIIFENKRNGFEWQHHVIDEDSKETIDHHDGTQAVDIDGDGDLDLISIGWYNRKIWIYENKAINGELSSLRSQLE